MKILKKGGGSREKGGGGNEIYAPCACGVYSELCVSDFMEKKTRMVSMSWQMKPLILGRYMEILTLEMSIRSRLHKTFGQK